MSNLIQVMLGRCASANKVHRVVLLIAAISMTWLNGCAAHNTSLRSTAEIHAVKAVDFVASVNGESFVIRLVQPEQIAIASARARGSKPQGIVSGKIANGDGGFNRDPNSNRKWSWHLIPESVSFPEIAMELCDGRPSDVEVNKLHWINDIKMFCPRSAKILDPQLSRRLSPLDYKIPDLLPARAALTFVKNESNASWYKATWDQNFQFDPSQAGLALDMNTVNWHSSGGISIANKENNSDLVGHQHLQGPSPTTTTFENPPEHIIISPLEAGWIKEGGISILIHNKDVGKSKKTPTIATVDLVAQ